MKTELATIADQYSEAILDLALDEGKKQSSDGLEYADRIYSELKVINQVIKDTQDMEIVLQHPAIGSEKKRALLETAFKKVVTDLTMRAVELLLDKRRLNLLPQIETSYHNLLNQKKNIVSASLVCADKLNDSAIANIKARLTEHLGKKLELDVKVDPTLIGGVVLRLGDQVIDGSIKGKLQSLERVLMSV